MLKKLGRKLAKAIKKPAGAAAAGAMLGGKMKGPMGAVMGAGLGAMLARKRRNKTVPGEMADQKLIARGKGMNLGDDKEDNNLAGTAGTAAFKKGGMADKKGRAMKKTDADAMGRAMTKKPQKMMGGGMMRGYKKGGMAKKGC
jgi:hypothetical protein